MKKTRGILALLMSIAMALFIGVAIAGVANQYNIEVSPISIALGIVVVGAVLQLGFKKQPGHAFAIAQEIWVDYIVGNLFKSDEFLSKFFNESNNVLGGAVVHIANAGAPASVTKNRSSFPATVVRRTDTDATYPLDIYTTDPILILEAEKMERSYDLVGSVIGEHIAGISQTVSDDMLIKVAPAVGAQLIRTTGSASAEALSPSATGTRLALTKDDLRKAAAIMDRNNIPANDRYAVLPSDMYQQLLTDSALLARDGIFAGEIDLKNGIVGSLYGFKLMKRSSALVYDATPAIKALGAAGAATDNMGVLCFQSNAVTIARGEVKMFEQLGDPTNYGDLYSALVKAGGRIKRAAGVVAIVQA